MLLLATVFYCRIELRIRLVLLILGLYPQEIFEMMKEEQAASAQAAQEKTTFVCDTKLDICERGWALEYLDRHQVRLCSHSKNLGCSH